jgi:hypothetical protein
MENFLKEQFSTNKSNNLSKSNLSKRVKNFQLISEYSQKSKTNLTKINLKYRNNYKYNFNNIMNRTNTNNKNKIKKPDYSYSSFFSKTTANFFDSDFYSPNFYSPNKINKEKLSQRVFSAKTNYTDNRMKSSTTKYTKSGKIRDNSSKRLYNRLNLDISESNIKFNKKKYDKYIKKRKNKSILYFLESSKLVRKEKIINNFLENKYKYEKELMQEKFNKIRLTTDSSTKNMYLLNQFGIAYNKYLYKLLIEKIEERQKNEKLKENIIILHNEVEKLKKKVNKIKTKLYNLINIKEFIFFVKNRGMSKIRNENKSNIILLKQNMEEKIKLTYEEILSKYNKKKISKSVIKDFKADNNNLNKSFVRQPLKILSVKRYDSRNKNNNSNKNYYRSYSRMKTEYNIPKNTLNKINKISKPKKQSLIIENKMNINNYESVDEFKDNFNKLENIILNDLDYYIEKRREVSNLKNGISFEKYEENDSKLIESKIGIIEYLKKRNRMLKNQMHLIKNNFSKKQNINRKIHKKLYNILKDINKDDSTSKKLDLQNVFYYLNMDINDYYKKIHISKTLYIVKAIEKSYLFYKEMLKRKLEDKNIMKIYKNLIAKEKKEKEGMKYKLLREKHENEKIQLENKLLEKYKKICLTSHMKYNIQLYKKKKHKNKFQITNKRNDSFEQLLTYN